MALLDLLRKDEQGADPQFLRDGLRLLAQELMEAEVTEAIGAASYERTDTRVTSRNGVREREWDTRVSTIELGIPSWLRCRCRPDPHRRQSDGRLPAPRRCPSSCVPIAARFPALG